MCRCTKQGHQKPVDSKDDNTEKHCPVTVNPWHVKKAFKVMNELRRYHYINIYGCLPFKFQLFIVNALLLPHCCFLKAFSASVLKEEREQIIDQKCEW